MVIGFIEIIILWGIVFVIVVGIMIRCCDYFVGIWGVILV